MTPTVYEYSDPSSFLRDVLSYKQKSNPLFSLRAWSKQMGFKCHTSLVFLLNGKRKVRPEHIDRLNRGLKLADSEESYLRTLVHYQCASSEAEKSLYESRLRILLPAKEDQLLDAEKFRLVADWIHMAILEMTKLADFESNADWIAARLRFDVTVTEVHEAIRRLMQMNLLRWEDGRLVKTNERLTTPKDRASESIREHHKQVLKNALYAVDEQNVSERVYNACTMTVDSSRLEEAKELILKFRADMAKLMEKPGGDQTYQLGIQFFQLTETQNDENEGLRK